MKGVLAGALIVAGLTFAVAHPALRYDFVYDDVAVVLERRPFWELGPAAFLESTPWVTGRHLTALSLDLDRGALDPSGRPLPLPFHRTNIVLAALLSVMVLAFALRLGLSPPAATVAAAIFAVHPTHVDAVVSIVGRAELLSAIGVIAVVLTCLRRQADEATSTTVDGTLVDAAPVLGGARAWWIAIGSAVFGVLAVHSKESALCLPLLILAARALLGRRVAWVPAFAGTAVALLSWGLVTGDPTTAATRTQFVDNPLVYAPAFERIPKALAILWQYAGLMVWPHPLLQDRSWATTDPSVVDGWLATLAWIVTAGVAWGLRHRAPRAVFALAWFALAFAITANVVRPIGTNMAERLLLLPSLSVCLLAGIGVDVMARSATARRAAVAVAALLVVLLFGLFRTRAAAWQNEDIYFPAAAAASPLSAKAQFEHGNWLLRGGQSGEAEAAYARALALIPSFSRAASLRAESMAKRGDPGGGAAAYIAYLDASPDDADAVANVVRLLVWADRPQEAVLWAQRLVALRPGDQRSIDTIVVAETALRRANAAAAEPRANAAVGKQRADAAASAPAANAPTPSSSPIGAPAPSPTVNP